MIGRRQFLQLAALAAAGAASAGCDAAVPVGLGALFGRGSGRGPGVEPPPGTPEERAAVRLLDRAAYGPRAGDVARVAAMGPRAYVEEQLAPESIADRQAFLLVRRLETLGLRAPDVFEVPEEEAIGELRRGAVLRALYSERQLFEVMVEFWSDHFNVYAGKEGCAWLKVVDDREVIRPRALGNFFDLLRATATSPAMLVYLDGRASVAGSPNENYARELLELHALGVGGYTQTDVRELARALTGWRVRDHFWSGRTHFEEESHDGGAKRVLDVAIDPAGEREVDRAIDVLRAHPAVPRFIARRLCRRFVADDPPAALASRVAARFASSGGDVRETLRELLLAPEFFDAPPRLKRPHSYTMSALRALGASSDGGEGLQAHLRAMGHLPFDWPTPDGFPDGEEHWRAQLLARWTFAFDLAEGRIAGTSVDAGSAPGDPAAFAATLLRRAPAPRELEALALAADPTEVAALLLCAPAFQYQ
jgi:uncharacterized protein (DUF1800 family)